MRIYIVDERDNPFERFSPPYNTNIVVCRKLLDNITENCANEIFELHYKMKSKALDKFPLLIMNVGYKKVPKKIWKLMALLKEKEDIKFSFGSTHEERIIDNWVNLLHTTSIQLT